MSAETSVSAIDCTLQKETGTRVAQAAVWVTIVIAFVKVASTLKEFVVAGAYGRSDMMDAFLAAFIIPNLLVNLLAESMNQALVPSLIRVRLQDGRQRAQQLWANSLARSMALLLLTSVFAAIVAPFSFRLIAWNFSPAKLELSIHLFYALLPFVVLSGISANCSAVLNSVYRFLVPAVAPVLIPLLSVLAIFFFARSLGIWALIIGTLGGALLQLLIVTGALRGSGYSFKIHFAKTRNEDRQVTRQFVSIMLSSVIASGGLIVDQALAATLPSGSIAALAFGGRFISVACAVIAGSVASTVSPHLATLNAQSDWEAVRSALRCWTRRMLMVSVPTALCLILGSRLLIRITLQHGAFTATDTPLVASVVSLYALQIPFFAVSRVHYRFLLAMNRSDLILYCGIVNLVLDVVLDLVCMRWMGVAGLALATSLWTIFTWAFLAFWSRQLLRRAEFTELSPGERS